MPIISFIFRRLLFWITIGILFPIGLVGQDWGIMQSLGGTASESLRAWSMLGEQQMVMAGSFEDDFQLLDDTHTAVGEEDVYALIVDEQGMPQKVFTLGGNWEDQVSGVSCWEDKIHLYGSYNITATLDTITLQTSIGTKGLFIAQYDTTGAVQWAHSIDGNVLTVNGGISHDEQGRLYLTGYFYDTLVLATDTLVAQSTEGDMFVAQIDNAGNIGWIRQAGETGIIRSTKIAVAPNGEIVVAGYFRGKAYFGEDSIQTNTVDHDLFVARMNHTGAFIWGKKLGGVLDDELQGLALDEAGNIYLTGYFLGVISDGQGWSIESSGFNNDVFIIKMNNTGQVEWGQRLGGTNEDAATAITTRGDRIAITGYFQNSTNWGMDSYNATGNVDGIWLIMNTAGTPLATGTIRGSGLELPSVIHYGTDGQLWIGGTFTATLTGTTDIPSQGEFDVFWTISDTQVSTTTPKIAPPTFYPNPCTHYLYARQDTPFTLYNALGQMVGQSQNKKLKVSHLPKGMYWVKMGDFVQPIRLQ